MGYYYAFTEVGLFFSLFIYVYLSAGLGIEKLAGLSLGYVDCSWFF